MQSAGTRATEWGSGGGGGDLRASLRLRIPVETDGEYCIRHPRLVRTG